MNVAIPILNENIAPCFESANTFRIIKTKGSELVSSKSVRCEADSGIALIKFLENHKTGILICNGIKDYLKDQLTSFGIKVIADVKDNIDQAIDQFLCGELVANNVHNHDPSEYSRVMHRDLVNWAGKLFRTNGFDVTSLHDDDTILTDLAAVYPCPVCRKPIKIGICCGGQIYSPYKEIREFFHLEKNRYHVCLYVHPFDPKIEQCCAKYGIEFLCPGEFESIDESNNNAQIPILKNPIESHKDLQIPPERRIRKNNQLTQTE